MFSQILLILSSTLLEINQTCIKCIKTLKVWKYYEHNSQYCRLQLYFWNLISSARHSRFNRNSCMWNKQIPSIQKKEKKLKGTISSTNTNLINVDDITEGNIKQHNPSWPNHTIQIRNAKYWSNLMLWQLVWLAIKLFYK